MMKTEYDNILKKWIVWKTDGSLKYEKFRADTKKECVEYINLKKKKSK